MSVTSFRPVSWNPGDNITKNKLNVMAANEQWLFDNIPRADYNAFGVHRNEGIRLVAGSAFVPTSTHWFKWVDVHFPNVFSSGCVPIVTVSPISGHIRRIHLTVQGYGTTQPDARGFRFFVSLDQKPWEPNRIYAPFFVHYHAVGY